MKNICTEENAAQPLKTLMKEYPNIYTTIPSNQDVCPFTGLKHAQLYRLLTGQGLFRDHVRVAHITLPGKARGKTLFHVGDFLRHLDALSADQGSGRCTRDQQQ
jgi:hypothetical protein